MAAESELLKNELEKVYKDRNMAVLLAASYARRAGDTVGVREDDPEWPIIAFQLPDGRGEVSWHLPQADLPEGISMESAPAWDGYTKEACHARVQEFTKASFAKDASSRASKS